MRIGILGAGFTGLAAALKLQELGHQVTVYEKESGPGGLAGGFQRPGWDWTTEKAYHHWFTNDEFILKLARQINHQVIIKRPHTDILVAGKISPFDSPFTILTFPYLPLIDKLRMGLVVAYLKYLASFSSFEGKRALPWIRRWMGSKVTDLIWEPLFNGKFSHFKEDIVLTWFWGRIKKRTPSLAYPDGGFQSFADKLTQKIISIGGTILFSTTVTQIQSEGNKVKIKSSTSNKIQTKEFDKVIVTLPSPIFSQITPGLPADYINKLTSIPHLHALNLILILKKPFLNNTYWLNITDQNFPFLVLAEQTNFMDPKHYNNEHILYIGNYLPDNHPYLKMSAKELLKIFGPYLKRINPNYEQSTINYELFKAPFAQPIVDVNYSQKISTITKGNQAFLTPLKNIYLANMDMVYPWDRETNYAASMGDHLARSLHENLLS